MEVQELGARSQERRVIGEEDDSALETIEHERKAWRSNDFLRFMGGLSVKHHPTARYSPINDAKFTGATASASVGRSW
jgi:hypothetical protein